MSVRFDPTAAPGHRIRAGVHIRDLDDAIGAADLTTDEIDEIAARFAAKAAAARRATWRRRPSIRTSVFRPTKHRPKGGRK
jgi:hypothetical protein